MRFRASTFKLAKIVRYFLDGFGILAGLRGDAYGFVDSELLALPHGHPDCALSIEDVSWRFAGIMEPPALQPIRNQIMRRHWPSSLRWEKQGQKGTLRWVESALRGAS